MQSKNKWLFDKLKDETRPENKTLILKNLICLWEKPGVIQSVTNQASKDLIWSNICRTTAVSFFFFLFILLNAKHCMKFMQAVRFVLLFKLALISELWSYLDPVIVTAFHHLGDSFCFYSKLKP